VLGYALLHGEWDRRSSMMIPRWLTGCVVCGLLAWTPARADDITWLSADFPPLAMPSATHGQQGYMDLLRKRLADVLRDTHLRIGIAGLRSYGGVIDEVLKPLVESASRQVVQIQQDNSTKSLINMLHKGRFEYTLAYPGEMVYFGGKHASLHFYPIAGNSALVSGHVSCTRSPQTDRVFEDMVKIAGILRADATLRAAYEQWLPPYLVKPYRQRLARQLANAVD
jgi:hypothetical protein